MSRQKKRVPPVRDTPYQNEHEVFEAFLKALKSHGPRSREVQVRFWRDLGLNRLLTPKLAASLLGLLRVFEVYRRDPKLFQ